MVRSFQNISDAAPYPCGRVPKPPALVIREAGGSLVYRGSRRQARLVLEGVEGLLGPRRTIESGIGIPEATALLVLHGLLHFFEVHAVAAHTPDGGEEALLLPGFTRCRFRLRRRGGHDARLAGLVVALADSGPAELLLLVDSGRPPP